MGMNSPTGPSPIPPLDPAPVPTICELEGPFPSRPTSASNQRLNPPGLANVDMDVLEERIPFYLKQKGVEKSP